MKRLFAFDVDGTLLNSKSQLLPSTKKAVDERLKVGDILCIASGRPYTGILQYLNHFVPGEKYAIAANGAAVYTEKGSLLACRGISPKVFLDFYHRHLAQGDLGKDIYCYTADSLGFFEETPFTDWEVKMNLFPKRNLLDDPLKEGDVVLKIMVVAEPELLDAWQAKPQEEESYLRAVRTNPRFLEFVDPRVSKGDALASLSERLGIPAERVFSFGDEHNDVEMIARFQGVAMGNSIPECKEAAHFVTRSNDEDGIAFAIQEFCLKD